MLSRIGNTLQAVCDQPKEPSGWQRNELDDMKRGIELLYEFKKKLSELHPAVLDAIENMLQRPRY